MNFHLFKKNQSFNSTLPAADFLNSKNLNGKGLKVIIANDANKEGQAKNVANTIVKRSDILGVIGHWTSEMTMATVDIYNQNQLVSVSPGASTSELTQNRREFFFRISTTNDLRAEAMVDVLMNQNWIVGDSSLYSPKTLKIAQPKLLEKLIFSITALFRMVRYS